MAFMEKQVTRKLTWIEIDGSHGITFVDSSDAPDLSASLKAYGPTDVRENTEVEIELASEFYEGTVESVTLKVGYGARFSAPGYLDCTDWTVFDTEEEAQAYLDEESADDEDELEEEDSE